MIKDKNSTKNRNLRQLNNSESHKFKNLNYKNLCNWSDKTQSNAIHRRNVR